MNTKPPQKNYSFRKSTDNNVVNGYYGKVKLQNGNTAIVVNGYYGEVRLKNGATENEGRIEVRRDSASSSGKWGIVCDDSFDIRQGSLLVHLD